MLLMGYQICNLILISIEVNDSINFICMKVSVLHLLDRYSKYMHADMDANSGFSDPRDKVTFLAETSKYRHI